MGVADDTYLLTTLTRTVEWVNKTYISKTKHKPKLLYLGNVISKKTVTDKKGYIK